MASVVGDVGDSFGIAFVVSMILCGIVAIFICPVSNSLRIMTTNASRTADFCTPNGQVGVCHAYDMAHYIASFTYMVDHLILCWYLDIKTGVGVGVSVGVG